MLVWFVFCAFWFIGYHDGYFSVDRVFDTVFLFDVDDTLIRVVRIEFDERKLFSPRNNVFRTFFLFVFPSSSFYQTFNITTCSIETSRKHYTVSN